MSIPVDTTKLAAELDRFGLTPYLLTVTTDGRPHAVHTNAVFTTATGVFTCGAGKGTRAGVRLNTDVTLLFVAYEAGGYSLIVDGTASVAEATETVTIHPTRAVLHRPAPGSSTQ